MSISNTTLGIVSSRPYFDDFDTDKQFYRILARPRRAIQTREFNQIQSMAQDQVERFAAHIFKSGSSVKDGGLTLDTSVNSVKVARTFGGNAIDLTTFFNPTTNEGTTLVGTTSGAKARVLQTDAQEGNTYAALIVHYLSATTFTAGETISDGTVSASVASAADDPFNDAAIMSVDDGIYFVDGLFISVFAQTLVLEAFSATPTARVGFTVGETIVTSDDDASLLDNALGASNYLAPGADRLKITLTLTKKDLSATSAVTAAADEGFIELARVVDGQLTELATVPEYADLEKTLARRTYDESGDYTVRPFNIHIQDNIGGDVNKVSAGLEKGKAYIKGYEFETIGTQFVDVRRGRDTAHESQFNISTAFGNFFIANNMLGFLNITNEDLIDFHCVSKGNVNYSSNTTYQSTLLGTARVRSMTYLSGGDGANRTYNVFITDSRLKSLTMNAASSNSSGITLATATASAVDNAYNGATLTVVAGPGTGQTFTVTAYTGNVAFATVSPNTYLGTFSANTTTQVRLDFAFGQVESFNKPTSASSITSTANGDVAIEGRVGLTATGDAVLDDAANSLLFPFPHAWVKTGSLQNASYQTIRAFTGLSFSGNTTVTTLTLTTNNGNERFYPSPKTLIDTEFLASYVVISNANGQIIPFTANGITQAVISSTASGTPGQITFTANGTNIPNGNTVSVLARLIINAASPRTKTLVAANTTATSGSTDLTKGQVVISTPNNTPGAIMTLGTPDVTGLVKIYQTPNTATAPNTTYMASQYDVTANYTLDTGQRDNLYDHATIRLNPTANAATGQLLVCFNSFSHAGGSGFFDGDSYLNTDYASIPAYTSSSTGLTYQLRDVLDFRPTRQANTTDALANAWYTVQFAQIPHPVSTFTTDYDHYLGRTDALTLTRDREFDIVEGVSSESPQQPPITDDSMVLYYLTVPPYTASAANVTVKYVENKRYTMRDIGKLERRIEHLEYYTALNTLEKAAKDQTILDNNDVERFKNGLLVEPFSGHNVADVQDPNYKASIDIQERNLMPSFTSNAVRFTANATTGITQTGDLVTLAYTTDAVISQPLASDTVTINPFQVANYLGQMSLSPATDYWMDTTTKPTVYINVVGENDNWVYIGFGTEWNDWSSRWLGLPSLDHRTDTVTPASRTVATSSASSTLINKLLPETINQTVNGGRVIDLSVIPYMRTRNVWFMASGLKPATSLVASFDGTDVTSYVERANMLTLTGNAAFLDTPGIFETITANSGGSGRVVAVRGNKIKIVEANGQFLFANGAAALVTGATSNVTATVSSYDHWSGTVAAANSTTITLNGGASSNTNYYANLTMYIVNGGGAGGSATITAYDGSTKVATINTTSSTINTSALVAGTSRYSIGALATDGLANSTILTTAGDIHGVFYLPNSNAVRFRTGARLFRLTDNVDQTVAETAVDAQYDAEGTTLTADSTAVSTRKLIVRRSSVANDSVVVTNRVVTSDHEGWVDPIVQTIIIDPNRYPSGLFVRSIELYFKAKDTHGIPVTVQIRPTLSGYSLNGTIVPFAEKTLDPNAVNISDTPSVDNVAATGTTFTFPTLVHLLPGEYAINILTNSKEYVLHTAKIGSLQTGTNLVVSRQPYAGTLFKSQNAGVWAPVQDEDLMFRVHRAVFSTSSAATAQFTAKNPTSNVDFDTFYLATGHLDFAGTVSSFTYQSAYTNGAFNAATTVTPNQNVTLTTRQRLLNSGNTFIVRTTLSTADDAVSPVFDLERVALVTVQHNIGNGELFANGYVVVAGGSSYGASANVALTITGSGSGADAYAVTNSSGAITSVVVNSTGSGYIDQPTIAVGGGGSGASIVYAGEASPRGGNALTRYITRRVTLADGFDAGDVLVYLDAYRPVGTNIDVYYKVLSASDPQNFDDKSWVRMIPAGNGLTYSANATDYREYEYTTAANTTAYTSNGVTYSRFKTFAVKIVLRSTSTTVKPAVRDLRVIAVDE